MSDAEVRCIQVACDDFGQDALCGEQRDYMDGSLSMVNLAGDDVDIAKVSCPACIAKLIAIAEELRKRATS